MRAHLRLEVEMVKEFYEKNEHKELPTMIEALNKKTCYNYRKTSLYAVVRRLKPSAVVETGVAGGTSSYSILRALEDNGTGSLYSIDLPNATIKLPSGQQAGFLVPDRLKESWTLILGDAKIELPRLLQKLGQIDMFHHDSLHTDEHMKFEFQTVWPFLRNGGVLLSDDVQEGAAFFDFSKNMGLRGNVFKCHEDGYDILVGMLVKQHTI